MFELEDDYLHKYDLGDEWSKFSGLPFVFAVRVARKNVSEQFKTDFNRASDFGLENISEIVRMEQSNYPGVNIHEYFFENVSFNVDKL